MVKRIIIFVFSVVLLFLSATVMTAQETEKDSVVTSFKKGRWLAGLSGSISSGSILNKSTDEKNVSNKYSIEVSSGKFIMDRLNVGFNINMERDNIQTDNAETDNARTTENVFIGPKGSYYFSKSKIGSLFFSFSPGFIIYREEVVTTLENVTSKHMDKGYGYGILSTLGYSYVVYDFVVLDLGLNFSNYQIKIEQKESSNDSIQNVDFVSNGLSFSFGFKILLGK